MDSKTPKWPFSSIPTLRYRWFVNRSEMTRIWGMDSMRLDYLKDRNFCEFNGILSAYDSMNLKRRAITVQLKKKPQQTWMFLVFHRRGLIQRCGSAKVVNFISLGGQHQGIFGVPLCNERGHLPCQLLRLLLNYFAYTDWVQKHIVQATYWHDPMHQDKYRIKSSFLADINNERKLNKNYIQRLHSLNKFVMVKFSRDSIVTPLETSWFGFFKPLSTSIVLSVDQLIDTTGDKLELRQMMDEGKIVFMEVSWTIISRVNLMFWNFQVDSGHDEFAESWFVENIVPFLSCKVWLHSKCRNFIDKD